MSSIVIKGNTSGQIELAAPDVAGSTTLTLPTGSANMLTDTSSLAAANLTGTVATSLLPTGTIKQVVSATSGAVTVNTTTPTPIVSLNITTTGSSKLYCAFSSDLNSDTTGAWKRNGLQVDGVWLTINISSTADAGFQSCISLVGLSGTLSAGSHSVVVAGWQGTGQSTYNEESSNGNSLVVMEVAA